MTATNHIHCQSVNPSPYEGTVPRPNRPGDPWPVTHIATYENCGPLLDQVGVWAICTDGLMGLGAGYFIASNRFEELDWIEHMRVKSWVDIGDFGKALDRARSWKRAGYMVCAAEEETPQ